MASVDFFITKASESDGARRWRATVSKFEADKEDDQVTPDFYTFSAERIQANEHPRPALVVSHYDDPREKSALETTPDVFAAGWATEIFVNDGKPQAKGVFADTPLGNALYEAVKADIDSDVPDEERVRISMAWRPLDGGVTEKNGTRLHTKGIIRHFAATRVPIVEGTELTLEKSDGKKTKLEDASTIVGEELAEMLEHAYVAVIDKSEGADEDGVSKADTDEEVSAEEPVEKAGKKPRKPTAMAACVNEQVDGGKERREAIRFCLQQAKKNGVQLDMPGMKAAVESGELFEKRRPAGSRRRSRRRSRGSSGGGDDEMVITDEMQPCIADWRERGLSLDAAYQRCMSQAKKTRREEVTARVTGSKPKANLLGGARIVEKPALMASHEECVKSYLDEGMTEEAAMEMCRHANTPEGVRAAKGKADMVEKPPLDAPMGACIKRFMQEGKKKDQAIAICLSEDRKQARKKAGVDKDELDDVLAAMMSDEDMSVVTDEPTYVKSENDEEHPAHHYLVAIDPRLPDTWHLRVRDADGVLDADLMDQAWKALTDESHAQHYKGPDASNAQERLQALYEVMDWQTPDEQVDLDDLETEDILLMAYVKAEQVIEELNEENEILAEAIMAGAENMDAPSTEDEATATEETERGDAAPAAEETEVPVVEEQDESEADEQAEDAPAQQDMNDSDATEQAEPEAAMKLETESGEEDQLDKLAASLKAALDHPELDRGSKVELVNTILQQVAKMAESRIAQTVPSADDQAGMFKSQMEEVINPLINELAATKQENAELKARLENEAVIFQKPQSRQLRHTGPVRKSDADDGGALTADQVASQTVRYSSVY